MATGRLVRNTLPAATADSTTTGLLRFHAGPARPSGHGSTSAQRLLWAKKINGKC